MASVDGHLVMTDGSMTEPTRDAIAKALSDHQVLWPDFAAWSPRSGTRYRRC
jgi:hypothetical protein